MPRTTRVSRLSAPSERGASAAAPAAARATLQRRVFLPVDAALAAGTGVAVVAPLAGVAAPAWLLYLPFAASLVVFGLPHGAIDELVPNLLSGTAPSLRPVLTVVAVYLLLGAAVLGIWVVAPAVAFAGFIGLTWFHWGQGDVYQAVALEGGCVPTVGARVRLLLVRGAIPMLAPMIVRPEEFRSVFLATAGLFDPHLTHVLQALLAPAARIVLGAALLTAIVAERALAAAAATARERRAWRRATAETALLVAFFSVTPAVLAIGVYFGLWHSLRHIARLQLLDPVSARSLARGHLAVPLLRFTRAAAPLTLAAIALLAVLLVTLPHGRDPGALLGVYLVLISALTVPHVVVVAYMDRWQGVWRPDADPRRPGGGAGAPPARTSAGPAAGQAER